MTSIRTLAPTPVWEWFDDICAVPHPTYREQALAETILNRARAAGITARQDDKGNLYFRKPACGTTAQDGVILQAHIDMVAQKTPDSPHDFAADPIRPRIDGDWVRADNTTLGADNGIGAAMALAVLFADNIQHPPLEVLLTVEEETGMGGVRAVQGDWLQGKYLINLDTEENGSIYLGCAGGRDAELSLPLQREAATDDQAFRISVSGMLGGHSGIDIHRGRGNAVKLLADTLNRLQAIGAWRLHRFSGGTLRNVIPREAVAEVVLSAQAAAQLDGILAQAEADARTELGAHAAALSIRAEALPLPETVFTAADSFRATDLLCALPDGVLRMSDDFDGVAETSVCLSVAQSEAERLHICLLMRSLLESPKDALSRRLAALARLSGAELLLAEDYPGWTPDRQSRLFAAARRVFAEHLGHEPKVEVIHAGLECGLMQQRLPDVEMISFGPTIEGAHTPHERVNIATVAECWEVLLKLLKNMP